MSRFNNTILMLLGLSLDMAILPREGADGSFITTSRRGDALPGRMGGGGQRQQLRIVRSLLRQEEQEKMALSSRLALYEVSVRTPSQLQTIVLKVLIESWEEDY